ncbi:MAG: DUF2007 domain-containing protein [Planctomycetes bacterium]|nr:DUF2007 domain-containing protein [Planctomycetota bacterium]
MKQIVVYTAASAQQAHLLKNILEEMGIVAHVTNDALQGAVGELPLGWAGAPRVVVAETDNEQARKVAIEFDRRLPDDGDLVDGDLVVGDEDLRWSKWPACPDCGRRRQAVCPICETAGNDVPLAEFLAPTAPARSTRGTNQSDDDPETDETVLLMCPNCDESFRPRFYRHCENCSHDFGFGVVVETQPGVEFNPRILLVVGALIGMAVAASLYVWLLFL